VALDSSNRAELWEERKREYTTRLFVQASTRRRPLPLPCLKQARRRRAHSRTRTRSWRRDDGIVWVSHQLVWVCVLNHIYVTVVNINRCCVCSTPPPTVPHYIHILIAGCRRTVPGRWSRPMICQSRGHTHRDRSPGGFLSLGIYEEVEDSWRG
jgi:hypothetical protein